MRITSLIIRVFALTTLIGCASNTAPKIGAAYIVEIGLGPQAFNYNGTLVAIDRDWLVLDTPQRSENGDQVRVWIPRQSVQYVMPNPNFVALSQKIATPAQLTEPPKLRFLAWQDENSHTQDWKRWKSWHADGSRLTRSDLALFALALQPAPSTLEQRYGMNVEMGAGSNSHLHLWFSQPQIATPEKNWDQAVSSTGVPAPRINSYEVTLLDPAGHAITQASVGEFATTGPFTWDGANLGWLMANLSFAPDTKVPPVVTIRLRYTFSAWEHESRFGLQDQPASTWDNGVQFNGIGLDRGNPALFIAVDEKQFSNLYFDVAALSSDGQAIAFPSDTAIAGGGEGPTYIRYTFAASPNIAQFRLRSKQIRTAEFKDVVIRNAHQP